MLPEPTEKHQPWPGNRDLFSPTAGNRAGLCACPSLRLEKPTFPSRETPNSHSHTHTAALCSPSPEPGGMTRRALCTGQPPGTPTAGPQSLIPILAPGHGAPNSNVWSCQELEGTCSKGMILEGTRDRSPPSPGDIPRTALLRVARTDIVLLSLSPCRTQPQPRLGMFNELRTKLLPPQQTPSDGRNPPKAAITQLRRIWVTAVSHGHPESDSTLLEGPDPAADFPGRGSKTPRKGKDGRTSPADPSPASSGMLPGQEMGSKCIPCQPFRVEPGAFSTWVW